MTTFLITGANRGIGLALAEAIIARGDRVIATVRDPFRLPPSLREAARDRVAVFGMDVADARSIQRAAASLDEPVDVLINNAGVIGPDRQVALDMDVEGFMRTVTVNALGPLQVTKAFLPHLKRSDRPRVIAVSSQMGSLTYASHFKSDRLAYRASKAMVNKLMQGLATDLKPDGIPVLVVHPGWVRTDMGGSGADIAPSESAGGLLALADGLDLAGTGRFRNYDGSAIPW